MTRPSILLLTLGVCLPVSGRGAGNSGGSTTNNAANNATSNAIALEAMCTFV